MATWKVGILGVWLGWAGLGCTNDAARPDCSGNCGTQQQGGATARAQSADASKAGSTWKTGAGTTVDSNVGGASTAVTSNVGDTGSAVTSAVGGSSTAVNSGVGGSSTAVTSNVGGTGSAVTFAIGGSSVAVTSGIAVTSSVGGRTNEATTLLSVGGLTGTSAQGGTSNDGGTNAQTSQTPRRIPPTTVPNDGSPSSKRMTALPVGESQASMGYWEYLPPGYGTAPSPLLVFSHGAFGQGDGSLQGLQKLIQIGPGALIKNDKWPSDRPFVVLSPQYSGSGCFDPNQIDSFMRYAVNTYNIDSKRIYLTGQSCGAIGAWNYLADHLDEFVTAAVLISGDGKSAYTKAGCDLGRVAIWGLHNEDDGTIDSSGTIEPINALLKCDPPADAKLTVYAGATAHDAWTKTYDLSAGNDIYAWMLSHVHR